MACPSPAAEPGDGEYDDEQGDRDDRDADCAPQRRGQYRDAEIRRFGKPAGGAGADRRLVVAGDGAFRWRQGDLDFLRLSRGELRQLLRLEARFSALRGRRAQLGVAPCLAAVVAQYDGELAVLAGIGFAAEPAALARQRDAGLAEEP